MITPEIVSYIKTEKERKTPDSAIKSNLLANGWSEKDIDEAMSHIDAPATSGIIKPLMSTDELKKYRTKIMWQTFLALIVIDFIIILIMGGQGVFGVSPYSIIMRIIFIYIFSYLSVRGAKPEDKTAKVIVYAIARVIGALVVTIILIVGAIFIYCATHPYHY